MFPFLIGDQIEDPEDPVWKLALLLKSICEYVFAPAITNLQLLKLKQMIAIYLETRAKLFSKKLQPKHHYLGHYPELVTYFGPLIRLWTLRFESRHVFFKQAAKCANNFKNITKTLANKYVLNFAYKFTGYMFPSTVVYKEKDASPIVIADMKQEVVNIIEEDPSFQHILKSVDIHGITYSPGLWVLLGAKKSDLIVGEILFILYDGSKVKFVLKVCTAVNSNQGYYSIETDEQFGSILKEDLVDYYPLPAYEYYGKQCLTLKHTCPFLDE
ncbi:uncharacterized protein LOC117648299 [Thrips palmi]|uniref:Uncharacterized protein LOC117648299 n=1 Tax=Thrips palmi TaxID=161013 RepID=A0A6P8Z8L0_THRPL|nr:uncharacterized protein LOC117648299 [Thrips palmi]